MAAKFIGANLSWTGRKYPEPENGRWYQTSGAAKILYDFKQEKAPSPFAVSRRQSVMCHHSIACVHGKQGVENMTAPLTCSRTAHATENVCDVHVELQNGPARTPRFAEQRKVQQ
jgi:hypothetical protein